MSRGKREEGLAVILVLLVTLLLGALGGSLVLVGDSERRLAANYRADQETRYAAAAGLERTLADLGAASDWSAILAGGQPSTFVDATHRPTLASGRSLDLDAMTRDLQAAANGGASFGANTPVWRLFGWGPVAGLQPPGHHRSSQYLAIWVADDLAEVDGSPSSDSNGILTLHAEAFGPGSCRRAIEATVERVGGAVRTLSWREL